MSATITLGWWIAPPMITLIAFVIAAWGNRDDGRHGDYAAIGAGVVGLMMYGTALIVSLVAWLIWAIAA